MTLSSTKATCISTSQVVWLWKLLEDLHFPQKKPLTIKIQCHFVHEKIVDGVIVLCDCKSSRRRTTK
eukprot:c38004_g1_i1 orf=2-199(-)